MSKTCFECGAAIKFDSDILSPNGRPIPLELDGSLHDCPNKKAFDENWGLPSKQYQKRQKQQPQEQQEQLSSSLFYDHRHKHQDLEDRVIGLEAEVAYLRDTMTQLMETRQRNE